MLYDEIEQFLGKDVVLEVQASIQHAFVTSRRSQDPRGKEALDELLLVMLATVILPNKDTTCAARCMALLREALADVKSQLCDTTH